MPVYTLYTRPPVRAHTERLLPVKDLVAGVRTASRWKNCTFVEGNGLGRTCRMQSGFFRQTAGRSSIALKRWCDVPHARWAGTAFSTATWDAPAGQTPEEQPFNREWFVQGFVLSWNSQTDWIGFQGSLTSLQTSLWSTADHSSSLLVLGFGSEGRTTSDLYARGLTPKLEAKFRFVSVAPDYAWIK